MIPGIHRGEGPSACTENSETYYQNGVALAHFDVRVATPTVTSLAVPGLGQDIVRALAISSGFAYYTRQFQGLAGANDVRKVDLATGNVSVVAGDGTTPNSPFNAPQGLCVSGNNLFVADTGNSAVRRVDLTSGATTLLALRRAQ